MLTRERKEEIVQELQETFQEASVVFVIEPKPMPVSDFDDLRIEVRKVGGSVRMVKNTLALRALEETDYSVLADSLSKTSVFLFGTDSLTLSKSVKKFRKGREDALEFKGGVIDGKSVDFAEVQALADLPSLDELRAQLVGVIAAPASRLVRTISAVPQAVVNVLQNKVKKGE